jgi:hypothetical protein
LHFGAGADSEEALPSVTTPSRPVCAAMAPAAVPTSGCLGRSRWFAPNWFELVWECRGNVRARVASPDEECLSSVLTPSMPGRCCTKITAAAAACCVGCTWTLLWFKNVPTPLAPARGARVQFRLLLRRKVRPMQTSVWDGGFKRGDFIMLRCWGALLLGTARAEHTA